MKKFFAIIVSMILALAIAASAVTVKVATVFDNTANEGIDVISVTSETAPCTSFISNALYARYTAWHAKRIATRHQRLMRRIRRSIRLRKAARIAKIALLLPLIPLFGIGVTGNDGEQHVRKGGRVERKKKAQQDAELNTSKPMLDADQEFSIGRYSVAYINGDDNTVRCRMFDTRQEAESAAEKILKPVNGKPTRKWPVQIRYYGIGQTVIVEDTTTNNNDRATLAQFDEVFVKRVTNTHAVTVLTLNEAYGHTIGTQPETWVQSTVLKRYSPLEERIIELGGEGSYIRVVTNIPECSGFGAAAEDIASAKQDIVDDAVENGIKLNGKTFVPLGHTTNGAKDNTTIWVDRKIWFKLWFALYGEVAPDWMTTPAKQIAYLVGLQAVRVEYINLPFIPEDMEYFKSMFKTVKDNVLWVDKDKTVTLIKNKDVVQNTFDGQTVMSFTEKTRYALAVRRMTLTGESYEDARAFIDNEIEKLPKSFSMRIKGAADKGAVIVYKNGEYQAAVRKAWEKKHPGEKCVINGKNPDDIIMWCDETVLKTNISSKPGAAFHSKEEWNNAVRSSFAIGILISEHEDKLKDSSYQLTELLYGASKETVAQLARYEANYLKTLLNNRGIRALVGGARAKLAEIVPSFATEHHFRKDADLAYKRILAEMGEGKVHHHSHYALAFADPVAMAQWHAGWDVDEVTGVIAPKTVVITSAKVGGEGIVWRHPLLNIGAVLVMNIINTAPEGYEGLFNGTTSMFFSVLDSSATRMRADFDGDHTNWSILKPLINGIKETKEKYGDYLIDFEPPEGTKMVVNDKERTKYFKSLVQQNELGKNCYDLARVYGLTPDEAWLAEHPKVCLPAEIYQGLVPQDTAARKDRDANVNVDKGKHGGDANDKQNPDFWTRGLQLPCGVILHGMQKRDEFKALSDEDKIAKLMAFVFDKSNYTGNGAIDRYVNMVRGMVPMELPKVEDEFDYNVLMSSTEIGFRGLGGLFRKGEYDAKRKFNPTQGLFQNIALRSASEWQQITNGESDKLRRMDRRAFEELVRNQSLAEFADFAESAGRSLDDACDVVTAKMFREWDKMYEGDKAFGPLLWREYWADFGDMVIANAEANTDASDILEDLAVYNVVMVSFGGKKLYTYLTENRVYNGQQVIVETEDGNRILDVVHSGTKSWCELQRYAAENDFTEFKWAVPVAG